MTFSYNKSYNLSEQLISDLEVDINEYKPIAMEVVNDAPEDFYWQHINNSTPLMMIFPNQADPLFDDFYLEPDSQNTTPNYVHFQDAWESSPYWPNVDNLYQYLHEVRKALNN
jgi:hypothetical protein